MNRKNIDNQMYSLRVIIICFAIAMSAILIGGLIKKVNRVAFDNKLEKVAYGDVEFINPLVLENSKKVLDKSNSNIEIAEEINRVYHLNVVYGDSTKYLVNSVDATAIYDSNDVNEMLLELVKCLEKYPNNIFKEIQLKDYNVEVCLVNYFNNDNLALATRDSNNNFKIYLSNNKSDDKMKNSVHHEMYHILEYYMKLEFDINELYKDWYLYNPQDFKYEENISLLTTDYVFNLDKYGRSYFVSVYSKVSDKEDRAEVFASTMVAEDKPLYYTDSIGAIKNKMKLISDVIKQCFYSVEYGTSIYWTRYF